MRVLLVETSDRRTKHVSLMLRSIGAVVDQSGSGEETIELARHYDYDVVILDSSLADMEGYEVVQRMRIGRIETPVVVLSGLCRPQAKIRALWAGADDFITEPFDDGELLARIHAVVRRSKGLSQSLLRIGGLELNLDSKQAAVEGKQIPLTGKEYAILELLALRRGFVISKETFLNHLYGGMDEPEIKIIDVFVCKLRKKLACVGAINLIITVWGRGYMIRHARAAGSERGERLAQISNETGLTLSSSGKIRFASM